MYILIVARGYPTPKYPTYGIFEFDQAKALAQAGCNVVYAAIDYRSVRRWRKWGTEFFSRDGVEIAAVHIPCGNIPRKITNPIASVALQWLYRSIVKKYGKPDIIHAHFTDYALIAGDLKKKYEIPLVVTEHSSEIIKPSFDATLEDTARATYRHADVVVAVSPALQNTLSEKYSVDARYIPNVIDVGIFGFNPKPRKTGYRFVSVGNLIVRKRADLTIEAFNRAFPDQPNITLTIFGEGSERAKLEQLITTLGLSERVFLKGTRARNEIAACFNESDCFVLASRAETFGVAYVEAMAAGLPVIATRCGGVDAFIHEKNGVLVDIDDVNALAEAMRRMVSHGEEFNRKDIADEVISLYSPKAVADQLITVYNALKLKK